MAFEPTEDYTKSFAGEGLRENRKGESKCDGGNRDWSGVCRIGQVRWLSIRFVGLRFLFVDVIEVIEVVVVQWGDGPS